MHLAAQPLVARCARVGAGITQITQLAAALFRRRDS